MNKNLYLLIILVLFIGCSDFYPLYFDGTTVVVELKAPQDSLIDITDTITKHNIRDTVVVWNANFLQTHTIFMEFTVSRDLLGDKPITFYGKSLTQADFEFTLYNIEKQLYKDNIIHTVNSDTNGNEYVILQSLSDSHYEFEAKGVSSRHSEFVSFELFAGYDVDDTVSLNIATLNSLYSSYEISFNDSLFMELGSSYFPYFHTLPGDSIFGYLSYEDDNISSWIVNQRDFDIWIEGYKENAPENYIYYNKTDGDTISFVSDSQETLYFIVNNDSFESGVEISDFLMLKRTFY